jgi:hypothetical protein
LFSSVLRFCAAGSTAATNVPGWQVALRALLATTADTRALLPLPGSVSAADLKFGGAGFASGFGLGGGQGSSSGAAAAGDDAALTPQRTAEVRRRLLRCAFLLRLFPRAGISLVVLFVVVLQPGRTVSSVRKLLIMAE